MVTKTVKKLWLFLFCFLLFSNFWVKESLALDKICLAEGKITCPKFSPDGTKIAFINDSPKKDSLWLINFDGTNKTLIDSNVYSYNWGLKERCIFVTFITGLTDKNCKNGRYRLMRINLPNLEKQVIAEGTEGTLCSTPISSPRENIFAFGTTNFKNGIAAEKLTIMDNQNKMIKVFEKMGPSATAGFCWSPDGNKIAFFNLGAALKIAWNDTWKEIEKKYARGEITESDEDYYIIVLDLATGKIQKVRKISMGLTYIFRFLQWSNNSEDIYFNEYWQKGEEYFTRKRIKTCNISNGSEKVIVELESGEEPILLSPTEKSIVFYSFNDSYLYSYDLALKQKTPLLQLDDRSVITGYFHKPIDFSNDGSKLVVGTKDGLFLLKLNESLRQ